MDNEFLGTVIPAPGGVARRDKRHRRPPLIPAFKPPANGSSGPLLGEILVRDGKLAPDGADRAHQLQSERQLRFGEAAVQLGLVSDADVQRALAQQFDYPYLAPDNDTLDAELVAAFCPFDQRVEAFRALRSQIVLRWLSVGGGGRAFSVIGPGRGDGRSYLAANLAVVFAQLGTPTVLIDADMRAPRQHQLFKLNNRSGLSSILAGRGEPDSIQRVPLLRDLSVVPAGPLPPNPQELLVRPVFQDLLEELGERFRVIIVDTTAAASGADAQFVSRATRAALLVVRRNHTRVGAATRFTQDLGPAGVNVLGTVLNQF